jgi:hypothetical protein
MVTAMMVIQDRCEVTKVQSHHHDVASGLVIASTKYYNLHYSVA